VEDPDAPSGTFHHWAVYDIPPDCHGLEEAIDAKAAGFHQGINDFGNSHYDGPQPPKGDGPHRYRFRLAALNVEKVPVDERPSVVDVWHAARGHILAEADLTGRYQAHG